MSSFDNLSSTQKIRAALHRDVRAVSTETCHFLGLEITKPAMEIVAELVYKKLSVYGTDLEAFAKHAKRATINSDDVKLLVRRCPSLKSKLNSMTPNPKEKRKKTVAGKVSDTPASIQKEPDTPILKQREPETSSKHKDPEIPASKHKEPETSISNQKATDKQNEEEKAAKDSMVIEDMIDLTFD